MFRLSNTMEIMPFKKARLVVQTKALVCTTFFYAVEVMYRLWLLYF